MEKRILIAFLISYFILVSWAYLFPPKNQPQKTNLTQAVVNKEVIEKIEVGATAIAPTAVASFNEKLSVLENNNIKLELSNIGGHIKNLTLKEFGSTFPINDVFNISGSENTMFEISRADKNSILYSAKVNGQKIYKEYKISEDYLIDVNVQSEKMSNMNFTAFTLNTSNLPSEVLNSAEKTLYEYSVGMASQIYRKGNAFEFHAKEDKSQNMQVNWLGFRDHYYCMIIKPDFKISEYDIKTIDKNHLSISFKNDLNGSSSNTYSSKIFIGPQKLTLLSKYHQDFEQIMVFSNWGILDIFAKIIYFLLHFLHFLVRNWGLAIILLGICIFAITYPLTAKSMVSMRKMQALQPQIKALQDKYSKDPQRMNQEMMLLYKENNVNPFGGCLPMILQMPIFIGLYQVLWRSVDFKGSGFAWITDLSKPDRLFILPNNLPIIGNEINVLPLLMVFIMFFQQKFSSKNMVLTDPAQVAQQKMMLIIMPVFMGFIFYHFASGLTLYFSVFYTLSTLAQFKMSKQKF